MGPSWRASQPVRVEGRPSRLAVEDLVKLMRWLVPRLLFLACYSSAFEKHCAENELDYDHVLCQCVCEQCQGHISTATPCPSLCIGTFPRDPATSSCGVHCEIRFPPNELICTRVIAEHHMTDFGMGWSKERHEAHEEAKKRGRNAHNLRLVFVTFSGMIFMGGLTFYVMRKLGRFRIKRKREHTEQQGDNELSDSEEDESNEESGTTGDSQSEDSDDGDLDDDNPDDRSSSSDEDRHVVRQKHSRRRRGSGGNSYAIQEDDGGCSDGSYMEEDLHQLPDQEQGGAFTRWNPSDGEEGNGEAGEEAGETRLALSLRPSSAAVPPGPPSSVVLLQTTQAAMV